MSRIFKNTTHFKLRIDLTGWICSLVLAKIAAMPARAMPASSADFTRKTLSTTKDGSLAGSRLRSSQRPLKPNEDCLTLNRGDLGLAFYGKSLEDHGIKLQPTNVSRIRDIGFGHYQISRPAGAPKSNSV